MEEKEVLPMDFLMPIVAIDENPPPTGEKSPKLKRSPKAVKDELEIKEELDIKEEPEVEVEEATKRKRGRPKKTELLSKPPRKRRIKKEKTDKAEKTTPKKKRKPKEEVSTNDSASIPIQELIDNRVYKCTICKDDKERTQKDLKDHFKLEHPGKRLRASRFCNEQHPCDVCGKEFKSPSSVRDHMETHNTYYYCDLCNHSTKKILDHIIHLRVHSELGLFECLMCDFKCIEINVIKTHVTDHEDLLRYWCDSCKKGFRILAHFQEHDNYHTGLKPFDCLFCGKCFLYSRYLHAHKLKMHKDEVSFPKFYQCVLCHKIYQHRNSLTLHMNSHTGNFAICDICGKMLSSKEKLKFHIRIHTGYKPYSCQYCAKSFTKKPILVEHVRTHTGEKPYLCDYCTKAFSQRSSLVIHMRGHTGEKPYVCQFCAKGFVAKAMLNMHLKSCKELFNISKMDFQDFTLNDLPPR